MISPNEARAAMLAAITPRLQGEVIPLQLSLGRVLAENVFATCDQPPFDASAMDGYALRASETPGNFQIRGEAAAGRGLAMPLDAGEAARIFTGAPMPEAADSVLIQEDALFDDGLLVTPTVRPGRHVRMRGTDFRQGDLLLRRGTRINPRAIALAAASGHARISVLRAPRIAILGTGNEIVPPGTRPGPHQIFESNSFALEACVRNWGGEPLRLPSMPDRSTDIARAAELGMETADLLVTIGGASVGDHDLVRPALATHAAQFIVPNIGIRPGKPTFFADTLIGPVLGLPGNPASCLVCALLFLKPIVRLWLGQETAPAFQRALMVHSLDMNGPREAYLRAHIEQIDATRYARLAIDQDSSLLSTMHSAGALLRRPRDAEAAEAGSLVDVLLWNDP